MKRNLGILAALAIAVLAIVLWQRRDRAAGNTKPVASAGSAAVAPSTAARTRPDPRTLARGTIAGTITDEAKAPVAGARVCADGASHELDGELLRDPTCTATDVAGAYTIENLWPARYTVSASGKPFRPDVHHPGGDRHETALPLAAGERKTGIDITLRAGGVELNGVVSDITGGPIAEARVTTRGNMWTGVRGSALTETDANGKFSMWVAPGDLSVSATAEGYADGGEWTKAPGTVEILLTPESSLAGTVIDAASGAPVPGARVEIDGDSGGGDSTFTNAEGAFRIARLTPGRYVATARTDRGYGRTEGSTLVGLGQHVDGVVVKLFPAVRLEGKVIISTTQQPCTAPQVSLNDSASSRWIEVRSEPDGRVWAEGVLPGKYTVDVGCRGFQGREKYDPIVVTDKDVTGLVWEVDPGATVRGRVLAKSGTPVEDADIWARSIGGNARGKTGWGGDRSTRDGSYELTGLRPGSYKLEVSTDKGVGPKDGYKVEVAAGATVEQDLVIEDAGSVKGLVVDAEGKPVGGISVSARALAGGGSWSFGGGENKTADDGTFSIESLRPGEYRISAQRSWSEQLRKPGTSDDAKQGERATVRANQTATVRITVESQSGKILGLVTDTAGQPVADAFVSAARESDAAGAQQSSVQQTRWSWDERPVITSVDGTFTLAKLSPGRYTVRAFRKGGGEAIAEHVAIGATAKLQIKATGSIEGTARRADGATDEITISVHDPVTGFWRGEQFYRTDGRFLIRDVPAGHFRVTAQAEGGQKQLELDLADGETKTGVTITLDALVTLTGRVVEHGTTKPVAGIRMMAFPVQGGGGMSFSNDEREHISDDAGRFTIKNAPRGKLQLRGFPKDWNDADYGMTNTVRTVEGTGTIDIGDIQIFKKRVKANEPVGELGINFVQQPRDTPADKRELKVSFIEPAGPAAKTELKVGDVITAIDGVDITGPNAGQASVLMRAPPGTKLVLGLARGATVTVTLAAP
ncbi:MAG: carboxypeptidase regulatory-like domain-containing protein [Deltaproteobacteria bacterium]|nr:carboxypeptidase regulatory-like domain-containing protein [Deltaproteobacteria bacterium]